MIIEISKEEELAQLFKALSDPTRLRIFEFLRCCERDVEIDEEGRVRRAGELSVGEVCCRFSQRMSTVSHHLRELRLAGLVRMEKRGRSIFCSVNPEALGLLREFVEGPAGPCGPPVEERNGCC
jgi:ArsR family transcriptional regulator